MATQETVRLLDSEEAFVSSIHKMSIESIYKEYHTSPEGLSMDDAKKIREYSGLNNIPPPLSAPAWLCCLLPCLLRTKSMEQYNECVPELAEVRRKGRWVKMDSASVVPGDVIKVDAGQRIPADLRIIEAKQCAFDTSYVTGSTHKLTADPSKSAQNYLDSPNMAFLGYLCTTGNCTGIAVATGSSTVVAKLITKKQWPPSKA